jgi:diadenosine tetraphosphate (Ap4A) HIT family hydrolase
MCRLAKEQKVGAGVLEITSKKLEIVSRELERVDDEISLVVNEYGYKFYDGQMVRKHLMVLPIEHYARLSDLPRRTKKAYDHILPLIMDVVDMSFTRSPGSKGSSQKGHLHTHAMIFDETVEELHFNRSDGTVIRRSGSTELEHL